MKYFGVFVLCLIFIFALAWLKVSTVWAFGFSAFGSYANTMPFGGRVIFQGPQGNFMCDGGVGPVTQSPAGTSLAAFYYYPFGQRVPPKAGDWVLGNYSVVPNFTSCYYNGGYRAYAPVYEVRLYGKSGLY